MFLTSKHTHFFYFEICLFRHEAINCARLLDPSDVLLLATALQKSLHENSFSNASNIPIEGGQNLSSRKSSLKLLLFCQGEVSIFNKFLTSFQKLSG